MANVSVTSHKSRHKIPPTGADWTMLGIPIASLLYIFRSKSRTDVYFISSKVPIRILIRCQEIYTAFFFEKREAKSGEVPLLTKPVNSCLVVQTWSCLVCRHPRIEYTLKYIHPLSFKTLSFLLKLTQYPRLGSFKQREVWTKRVWHSQPCWILVKIPIYFKT